MKKKFNEGRLNLKTWSGRRQKNFYLRVKANF
jgi:hypothetical protein